MRCPIVVATILRPTGETGIQTYCAELRRAMAARGTDVPIVTPFAASPLVVTPVFAVRRVVDPLSGAASVWWYRHWHQVFLTSALRRELAGRPPSVVYAQCPVSALGAMEARVDGNHRVVMMVNYNVSQAEEWADKGKIVRGGRLHRWITDTERRVLPRLDGIVFASEFSRVEVTAGVPEVAAVPSVVVPNFVADATGAPEPRATVDADLITVGTLEPRKNQAHLLRVVAAARAQGHRYSLSVVGDGPDRPALERLAAALGIAPQVRFLGFRPEVRRLFPRHRAYVHAAHVENCPLAVIEAMAAGLPVFSAPAGGIPEMVRDGLEGVLWPADEPDVCARSLADVLDSPERAADMSRKARERFLRVYEAGAVAPTLERFLCDRLAAP